MNCECELNPGQNVDGQKVDRQKVDGQKVDGQNIDGQKVEICKGDKRSIRINIFTLTNIFKSRYKSKELIYD